jgi:hypothetical protein
LIYQACQNTVRLILTLGITVYLVFLESYIAMHRCTQVEEDEEQRRESLGNKNKLGILPILTAHSADLAYLNLPLLFGTIQSERDHSPHRQKDIRSFKFFVRVASKKLQNYYFPPRPTHRLSRPNRPITSMQMQPATQVHVPESPSPAHTQQSIQSLDPPCVLPTKLQKKEKKKPSCHHAGKSKQTSDPQTPLFACREA